MVNTDDLAIRLRLDSGSRGWAEFELAADRQRVCAACSSVTDTLGQLVVGVADLAQRDGGFELHCASENRTDYRVRLRRAGERITVTAKAGSPLDDKRAARNCRTRFRWEGGFRPMARRLLIEWERMLDEARVAGGYERLWGHPLPTAALETIRAFVRADG